ncbi:hypothetical protein BC835DRAFT_251003 [Cytidiella melzeri]|nr:hypothetical protein BC835DRAFT_251003 [Cytidiella melzeri]
MATRVASQNTDTVDLVFLPLLIIIVVIFVLLVGSSRQRDATLKQTVSRQHHPARKEKTRQSKLTSRALTRLSHPKVPVEIVEHIIDYLQGNNRALATCKLVHRSWLPRARIHLHRTMIIEQGGPDPFKLKFFPQVARHVRKLVVSHVLLSYRRRS